MTAEGRLFFQEFTVIINFFFILHTFYKLNLISDSLTRDESIIAQINQISKDIACNSPLINNTEPVINLKLEYKDNTQFLNKIEVRLIKLIRWTYRGGPLNVPCPGTFKWTGHKGQNLGLTTVLSRENRKRTHHGQWDPPPPLIPWKYVVPNH